MALKVMPKASTKLQGFLREYCISLHLSCHPCIVGLFGIAFQSNEHYCFAQELVIGRDLFAVIQPKVRQTLAKQDQDTETTALLVGLSGRIFRYGSAST